MSRFLFIIAALLVLLLVIIGNAGCSPSMKSHIESDTQVAVERSHHVHFLADTYRTVDCADVTRVEGGCGWNLMNCTGMTPFVPGLIEPANYHCVNNTILEWK